MLSNNELLKLLFPYIKPYYKKITFVLLLLPLGSLAFSVQPVLIQKAIDGPLKNGDFQLLTNYVTFFALIVCLSILLQIFQTYYINKLGQCIVADIRTALFEHLEALPMSYFDKTPVGRSVTRITSDVENLAESFAGGLIVTVIDLVNILGIVAFMSYLNFKLTLVVLIFMLPMILMAKYFQLHYRKANLEARAQLSKLNSFLQQNIIGISVVQMLSSIEKNMKIFFDNNQSYFKANDESIKADAGFSAGIEFVSITAIAVLIFISKEFILEGLISIGVLIAFLQYAQSLFEPVRNLSDRFTIIQAGFTAAERVHQLLKEPITIKDPEQPVDLKLQKPSAFAIEFENVYFRYGDDGPWILENLSFKLKHGEHLAIVGRTGSGKSTIIKLLTRLYEAQKGSIKVNGIDIKDLKQQDLRTLIAVIHQDSYIFAGSLKDNVTLHRDAAKEFSLVEPFLKNISLKLEDKLYERAANISAGEEQVISFARAIITKPEILVLDEATAKIDLKTELSLQNALEEYTEDKTSIVIAHRLETIKKAHRILNLETNEILDN